MSRETHLRALKALHSCAEACNALDLNQRSVEVSNWSVGEHLEHLLAAGSRTLLGIDAILSGQSTDTRELSPPGKMVLQSGQIPRGAAKAPEFVEPQGEFDADALVKGFQELCQRVEGLPEEFPLEGTPEEPAQPHFALGRLGARDWLLFTAIHSDHHLQIIAEITATTAK